MEQSHGTLGNRMSEQRSKYRFLFVSAPFSGIEVFFRNLREILNTTDSINATWAFIESLPKERIARIPPISLNWTLKGGLVTRSRIRSLERSGGSFDAAVFNHITLLPFLKKFMRRTPAVLFLDATPPLLRRYGEWYFERGQKRSRVLQKLGHLVAQRDYESAAYFFAWTGSVKESLVNDFGIPEEKIAVFHPGINFNRWIPPRERRSAETATSRTRVLFVGGDFKRKGGDLLLRIAQRAEFQDCEFHFVTNSFAGVHSGNVFVHSSIPANSEPLMALYREADIFVLPTRADVPPTISICEAMAMELPIVATEIVAQDEFVKDGEVGLFVPVDDEQALARSLRTLVQNPSLRTQLGRNGRKLVKLRFDTNKTAEKVLECLVQAAINKGANHA